jgi:hypothetical protein
MSTPRPIYDRGKRGPEPGSLTKSFPRWLRAMRPASLRIETEEGRAERIKVRSRADGQVRWKALVELVVAWGNAVKVEALDQEGGTIGVWELPVTPDELVKITERETRRGYSYSGW